MKDGFIKVACSTIDTKLGDVAFNASKIKEQIDLAKEKKVKVLVFSELAVSGYSNYDLFTLDSFVNANKKAVFDIAEYTLFYDGIIFLGAPFEYNGRIFNVVFAISNGKILAIIPKDSIDKTLKNPENRYFDNALPDTVFVDINGEKVPFGNNIIISSSACKDLRIAVEIGDINSLSTVNNARATLIVNPTASIEYVGKADSDLPLYIARSSYYKVGYMVASCGVSETSSDVIFSGRNYIIENGTVIKRSEVFSSGLLISEIDLGLITNAQRTVKKNDNDSIIEVCVSQELEDTLLTRDIKKYPFIPDGNKKDEYAELALTIQARALAKRLTVTRSKVAILGISGGLDSALAIIACVRAKEFLPEDLKREYKVLGITMPCFGTTERTLNNAKVLTTSLGAECKKISIRTAVNRHLTDIKHYGKSKDVTYENAQARERTQVLMDYANMVGGLVVGTGDLSEVALGWSTYNGDHMSMYGVNSSIPKTQVRFLVEYEANRLGGSAGKALRDILDTPVSPELLPPDKDGKIAQITEDKVGPYALHDFTLYHFVKNGASPSKIYRMQKYVFSDEYDDITIKKWLKVFFSRFFTQQFKRSCSPEGIRVGEISLSPRGDWKMTSDTSSAVFLEEIEKL